MSDGLSDGLQELLELLFATKNLWTLLRRGSCHKQRLVKRLEKMLSNSCGDRTTAWQKLMLSIMWRVNLTMEIFVYLHSNDVSVEGGERNNYPFPFIISIKPNGSDDRNLTDMRENKSYGRNSFAW